MLRSSIQNTGSLRCGANAFIAHHVANELHSSVNSANLSDIDTDLEPGCVRHHPAISCHCLVMHGLDRSSELVRRTDQKLTFKAFGRSLSSMSSKTTIQRPQIFQARSFSDAASTALGNDLHSPCSVFHRRLDLKCNDTYYYSSLFIIVASLALHQRGPLCSMQDLLKLRLMSSF